MNNYMVYYLRQWLFCCTNRYILIRMNSDGNLVGFHFDYGFSFYFQDDKYILKYLVSPGSAAGESKNEIRFNPITKINLILVRQSAVEKNSFYLINTNVTQMLELTAPSALECKTYASPHFSSQIIFDVEYINLNILIFQMVQPHISCGRSVQTTNQE